MLFVSIAVLPERSKNTYLLGRKLYISKNGIFLYSTKFFPKPLKHHAYSCLILYMKLILSCKNFADFIWRAVFYLREYFFPAGCAICHASLTSMDEAWHGLCSECLDDIDEETYAANLCEDGENARCDICGKPLVSEQGRCLACRSEEKHSFDRMIVMYPYTGKYQKILAAYKFGKNLALGHFWAKKIKKAVKGIVLAFKGKDIAVVPVPPRPGKIKKQGWDQVEYLARLLEKGDKKKHGTKITVNRCLKRLPSKIQKELSRKDRLKNLQNRIALVKKPPEIAIIIDDVITTGSTMEVCACTLKAGGTEKVYGICLVYD